MNKPHIVILIDFARTHLDFNSRLFYQIDLIAPDYPILKFVKNNKYYRCWIEDDRFHYYVSDNNLLIGLDLSK